MLATSGLSYAYGSAEPLHFPDFTCQAGEHWLLLGQSGSGKTTLLQLLAGLRSPRSGSIIVGETEMNKLARHTLDLFRGKHIGVIFQQSHFVRALTVRDNLALAQSLAGLKPNNERIEELLGHLNLSHKLHAHPSRLSVGEQQRVAIARAIINRPDVILADEPTSALDDRNTEQVLRLLREQAAAVNAVLLIVTHDNRLKQSFDQQIHL
ncbi:MAG: ABC transporter ATP-binding protein [Lewinella sp.]|nr:ABC transporter ATP-binding protein [Lewinella sp.]